MRPGRRRLLGLNTAAASSNRPLPIGDTGTPLFVARIGPSCLACRRIECRVCGEHCEAQAVRFSFAAGDVARPSIDAAACNGCGACTSACPAGAIALEPIVTAPRAR